MGSLHAVVNATGMVLMFFGLTMLLPLGLAWLLQDGTAAAFLRAMLATLAAGLSLLLLARGRRELKVRDGFLLVVLLYLLLPALASLPLLLSLPELSFTDAYFETVSGLTATGATVLSGLDSLPPSLNLWRAELVWLGGMGIIVLVVAVLPLLGVGGRQMYKAEIPGPMKEAKLTPRIAETAKGLWMVYVAFTLLCILAYHLAGMDWIDAVIHAFTTMGLGGFSSHDASFGYFDSPAIEAVAVCFMLVAGINFATHFRALHGLSLRHYRSDPEARWFLGILALAVSGLSLYLWGAGVYPQWYDALRYTLFNVVSVATTTGYANTDYALWPMFAPLVMLLLSSFTTSSGSTGGGMKMIRAMVMYRQFHRELVQLIHPRAVAPLKIAGHVVPNQIIFAVLAFFFVYIATIVMVVLLLTASGLDFVSAFGAAVACVNNLGPGLGSVGPASTYAVLDDFQTWVCTFAMVAGRLELLTFLTVLVPAFWRK